MKIEEHLKDKIVKTIEIKDRLVLISDAEISEEEMGKLSSVLKKAGAMEVIYAYGGIEISSLSEEDLKNIGLFRLKPV